jgi:aryl carrier-like protein
LWIGGAGVASGYRNDPIRTAAQFLTDEAGVRWYRTGDLGRYRPGGLLEFLGRRDFQVKIRGHRIELGEVEAALLSFTGVAQAVAVVTGTASGGRLAAAVVGEDVDVTAVTAWCRDRLPAYMVPDSIALLPGFPLSANGKVDRTALAHELTADAVAQDAEPPLPGTETRIAGLWAELLGVPEIRRQDNFFTLGGDSLLATRLVAEIRRVHGVPMSLRALLAVPTVAELAALVDTETASQDPDSFEEGVI